ncbi:PKD domain-containing protein [Thalassoroseus pseudoceratinae]|uniref:PKD domain-containing protein n=1 Tax=Thalassoroseus pseudoceratinae TaxID=2713176 RepID=UPI001420CB5C|nr:PKD domain-containing protein [Thalassoroseus pseudoceratinae]
MDLRSVRRKLQRLLVRKHRPVKRVRSNPHQTNLPAVLEQLEDRILLAGNQSPLALPAQFYGTEEADLLITLGGSDPDDDPLTATIASLPATGALYQVNDGVTRGEEITAPNTPVSDAFLRVIFVPSQATAGPYDTSFQFQVNDGLVDSTEAEVSLQSATDTYRVTHVSAESPNAELQNLSITSAIAEGGFATLSGEIVNPTPGEEITVTVNWGDRSTAETFTYDAGTSSFSEIHRYQNEKFRFQALTVEAAQDPKIDAFTSVGNEFLVAAGEDHQRRPQFQQVATDDEGNSLVVWMKKERKPGSSYDEYLIYGQRFNAIGLAMGDKIEIFSSVTPVSTSPISLAATPDGGFVVVWGGNFASDDLPGGEPHGLYVLGRRLDATGNLLGSTFRINTSVIPKTHEMGGTYRSNFVYSHSVAMDDAGNFIVIWSYLDEIGGDVFYRTVRGQRYDADGHAIGGEFEVNTQPSIEDLSPEQSSGGEPGNSTASVVMDAAGNFVVFWGDSLIGLTGDDSNDWTRNSRGLLGQRYDANGGHVGDVFVVTEDIPAEMQVAMDATGNLVAAWRSYQGEPNYQEIRGRRFSVEGSPLGEVFSVADVASNADHLSLAVNDAGDFAVSWSGRYSVSGRGNSFQGVMIQSYDANGIAQGRPFLINPVDLDASERPYPDESTIAMDTDGNLVVIYQRASRPWNLHGQWYAKREPSNLQVQVHNVAPELAPLWLSADTIDENGSVAVEVSFDDPGNDVHSIELDWGDGHTERVDLPYDGKTLTLAHRYPDDGLTTPASRQYTITATVIENMLLEVSRTATVTVNNIVPEIDEDPTEQWPTNSGSTANDPQTNATRTYLVTILDSNVELENISVTSAIDEGDTATLTGEIVTAAELSEDISITVDWGDNSSAETLTFPLGTESFSTSHQYQNNDARLQSKTEYHSSDSHHVGTSFTTTDVFTQERYNTAFHGVVVDQWGTTTALWTQGDHIYARRYDVNNEPLGDRFRVSSYPTDHNNSRKEVVAAVDADGNFMVVWAVSRWNYDRVRTSYSDLDALHAQRYDRYGQPLGSEFQLVAGPGKFKATKAIAMDDEGNFAVVWESNGYFPVKTQLQFQRFDANGQPLSESVELLALSTDQEADVAIDADGNAVVVWNNGSPWSNGVAGDIYAARFDSQGRQIGDDLLIQASDAGVERLFEPEITMDAEGNFIVAWKQEASTFKPSRYDLYARRYDSSGTPLGSPFRINPLYENSQFVYDYDILVDDDGSFIASWQARPTLTDGFTQNRIFLQRFDENGRMIGRTLNASQRISTLTGESLHHYYPSAVIDQEGNVDVWFSNHRDFYSLSWAPSDTTTYEVQVNNVAPVINPLVLSANSINENGTVTLNGSFSDPGIGDRHSVTIDWGDGTIETIAQPSSSKSFSFNHQYLDDPAGNGSAENYEITVAITDLQSAPVTATAHVTVKNVTPQIREVISSSTGSAQAGENELVTVRGTFTDVGTLDTHTVTIDWGDGNATSLTEDQIVWNSSRGNYEFTGTHTYPAGGSFPVTITVTDDDQGQATETVTTLIKGVGLYDGTLYVVDGFYNGSTTDVSRVVVDGVEKLRVTADFLAGEDYRDFDIANIVGIEMILGYLGDTVTIADDVLIPAIIDAGDDDDHIRGGGGNDSIDGGRGSDTMEGGPGDDIYLSPDQNDTFVFQGSHLGEDIIEAGGGTHTLDFSGLFGGINLDLDTGDWQTLNNDLRLKLAQQWTSTFGTVYDDLTIGTVRGTDYADVIHGGRWGSYNATFYGRGGSDRLIARGSETLDGGDNIDTYVFAQESNNFSAQNNTILAGGGYDMLDFRGMGDGITIDLASTERQNYSKNLYLTLQEGATIANVYGSDYDDVILGNSLGNRLYGYGGGDVLEGRTGTDHLWAGVDSDVDAVVTPDGADFYYQIADEDYIFTNFALDDAKNGYAQSLAGRYFRKPDDQPWGDANEIAWFDQALDGSIYWLGDGTLHLGANGTRNGAKRAAIDHQGNVFVEGKWNGSSYVQRLTPEGQWSTTDDFQKGADDNLYSLEEGSLYRDGTAVSAYGISSLGLVDGNVVGVNRHGRITFVARNDTFYSLDFLVSDKEAGLRLRTKTNGDQAWLTKSENVVAMAVVGDKIFELAETAGASERQLIQHSLVTTQKAVIASGVIAMAVGDGYIYYLFSEDGRVERRSAKTGEVTVDQFGYDFDNIYFPTNSIGGFSIIHPSVELGISLLDYLLLEISWVEGEIERLDHYVRSFEASEGLYNTLTNEIREDFGFTSRANLREAGSLIKTKRELPQEIDHYKNLLVGLRAEFGDLQSYQAQIQAEIARKAKFDREKLRIAEDIKNDIRRQIDHLPGNIKEVTVNKEDFVYREDGTIEGKATVKLGHSWGKVWNPFKWKHENVQSPLVQTLVPFTFDTNSGQTTLNSIPVDFGKIESPVSWFKASIDIGVHEVPLAGINAIYQGYLNVIDDYHRALPSENDLQDVVAKAEAAGRIALPIVLPYAVPYVAAIDALTDGDTPLEITPEEALPIAVQVATGPLGTQIGGYIGLARLLLPGDAQEAMKGFETIASSLTNPAIVVESLREQLSKIQGINFASVQLPEALRGALEFLEENPFDTNTLVEAFIGNATGLAWSFVEDLIDDRLPYELSGTTHTFQITPPNVPELTFTVKFTTKSHTDFTVTTWSVNTRYKVGIADINYRVEKASPNDQKITSLLDFSYDSDTFYVGANVEIDGKLRFEDINFEIKIKDEGNEFLTLTPSTGSLTVTIPESVSTNWAGIKAVYTQVDGVDRVELTIPAQDNVTKFTVTTPVVTGYIHLAGLTATRAGTQWNFVPNIIDDLQIASQEQLLAVVREKFPEFPDLVLKNLSINFDNNDLITVSFDPLTASVETDYISGEVTLRGFTIDLKSSSMSLDYTPSLTPKLDFLLTAFDTSLEEQLIEKINSSEDINPNNISGILDSILEGVLESMGLSAPASFGLTTTESQSEADKAATAVANDQWESTHPKVQNALLGMYGVKRAFKKHGSIGLLYEDGSAKFFRKDNLKAIIQIHSESAASEFGSETYQNLMVIAETLTGQQIFKRFMDTNETVVITWSPSLAEVAVDPSWTKGQPIPVTYNHLGSSIVGQDVGANNNPVSGAFLPEIDLAHELIHAVHIAENHQEALHLASPPNFDTDPSVVYILANMLLEESRTIGTGSYSPGKAGYDEMNENNFRRELWRNRGQTWYWHRITHAEHVEKKQLLENGPLQLIDSQLRDALQLPTPETLAETVEALPTFPPAGGFRIESIATTGNLINWLEAIAALPEDPRPNEVVTIVLNLTSGEYSGQNVVVPKGYQLNLDGTYWGPTLIGQSPSLTLVSGDLFIFGNVTFTNETDAPTILVQNGSLSLRHTVVQETTVADRPAIDILAGSVDLGTASAPGVNTIVINGDGNLIVNKSPKPISAIGNTFQQDSTRLVTSFEIEAKIEDAVDNNGGSGVVTFVPNTVFRQIGEGPFEMNLINLVADLGVSDPVFQTLASSGGTATLLADERTVRFVAPDDGTGGFTYAVFSNGQEVASRSVEFLVKNVAPSVNLGADFLLSDAGPVMFQDKFTDPGANDTHTFLWQVTSNNGQVIPDSTDRNFSLTPTANGEYLVTFTVTDDDGGIGRDEVLVTVNHFPPESVATFESVTFFNNSPDLEAGFSPDGTGQRSIIKGIQVVFDGNVEISLGAITDNSFRIVSLSDPSISLQLQVLETKAENGKTIATIGFASQSPLVDHTGSLIDGRYQFLVDGAVLGVDADGSGSNGGTLTTRFHRLFGDADGDADVDNMDYMSYRNAIFSNTRYSLFDFDGDSRLLGQTGVDPDDLNAFFSNYGQFL